MSVGDKLEVVVRLKHSPELPEVSFDQQPTYRFTYSLDRYSDEDEVDQFQRAISNAETYANVELQESVSDSAPYYKDKEWETLSVQRLTD